MMRSFIVLVCDKASDFIDNLDKPRRARVDRYFELFREFGVFLPQKYLKKITKDVWELRTGDVRLFLTVRGNKGFVIHGIYKKTQKTLKKDLRLAEKRIREEVG